MNSDPKVRKFSFRGFVELVSQLLKQGISPEKIALSLALGACIGIFPIIGASTTLCILVSIALGLNPIAIQIANYAMYPLQILLIYPFMRFGGLVLGQDLHLPELQLDSVGGAVDMVMQLGDLIYFGLLGWGISALPFSLVGYFAVLPFLRRWKNRKDRASE